MKKFQSVLDEIVCSLKEKSAFNGVRFIHSGRKKPAEKPVQSFLVACGVKSESVSFSKSGEVVSKGVLEFCVYAPGTEGKRALSEVCEELALALAQVLAADCTQEINMSDAAFDSDLTVWRQAVNVHLRFSRAEQSESGISIEVCGAQVSGVSTLSVLCNRDYYRVKELLTSDTGERVLIKEDYVLTLKLWSTEDIFASHPRGGISLLVKATGDEYTDCAVEKSTLEVTASGVVREYVLLCTRRKAG